MNRRVNDAWMTAIVEASSDAIISFSPDDKILTWNAGAAAMFGYSAQEVIGQSVSMLAPPDRLDEHQMILNHLMTGTTINQFESVRVRKNGEHFPVVKTISPVRDTSNTIIGMVAIIQDITERKRIEANIAFLSDVSQDLAQLTNLDETINALGAKIATYLGLSAVAFAELNETAEIGVIDYGWHRSDMPSLLGTYRMAEFVSPEILDDCRAGKTVIIRDVFDDPRTDGDHYAALNIGSFLSIPLVRDGAWRFLLVIYRTEPSDWHDNDIDLAHEFANRIWMRLERARVEEALRASEERFRRYTTMSSDVVYTMSADWNEMRYLIGKEFLPDTEHPSTSWLHHYIPEDDQPQVQTVIEEAIKTKRDFELEHRVVRVDGTIGWTVSHAIPLLDAHGDIIEWFGTASDITARKQAEAALAASEEKYRTIFNSIDEAFAFCEMVTDKQGYAIDYRMLEINPAFEKMTGLTIGQAQGSTAREVVPGIEEWWIETYARVAFEGTSIRFENSVAEMNRWFDAYAAPVGQQRNGKFVLVFSDISARKIIEAEREHLLVAEQQARAEAESALRTREQFLSIASHELRTPLTSMLGYASMLTSSASTNPALVSTMAERISRQAQRLDSLVGQLLDISRLQQGQFTITTQRLDLTTIVAQIVDMIGILSSATTHPISFTHPDEPVLIDGDTERLEQVFQNLVSNAVKYSPNGGPISITIRTEQHNGIVEVSDQGIGIPQSALARLFEPFYRASNVGSQASGFGLGLHIVREIVERQGGRIEVESVEGQGSTFRVILPHATS